MATNTNNISAVMGDSNGPNVATGALIFWKFRTVSVEDFEDAQELYDLSTFNPSVRGPQAAVRLASERVARQAKHEAQEAATRPDTELKVTCRPLARRTGFEVLVDEASTESTNKRATVCNVLRRDKLPAAVGNEAGVTVTGPKADVYRDVAQEAYDEYLGTIAPEALSEAARRFVVYDLQGTPLQEGRENGGHYYVPSTHADLLGRLKGLLAACGCRLYEHPAACANDLLDALFESEEAAAKTTIKKAEKELAKAEDGAMGPVAMRGCVARLESELERFQGLEGILGEALKGITGNISQLTEQFGAAAMAVEAAEIAEGLAQDAKEAAQ